MYACFHWAAIGIALFVQIGKRRTNWKYLWTVPILYSAIAALEALVAGSVTGAMSVYTRHISDLEICTGTNSFYGLQGWRNLHSRWVVHDHLDTLCLGLGQRHGAGCLIVLYLRRPVNTDRY